MSQIMAIDWDRGAVTAGLLAEFSRFHSMLPSKGCSKKTQMCFTIQKREEEVSKRGHTEEFVAFIDTDTSS